MSLGQLSKKDWLDKSIEEGFIRSYSESDILDRKILGRGGYGLVYKATLKHTGIAIAMKTLIPGNNENDEETYSEFVDEVVINYLRLFVVVILVTC